MPTAIGYARVSTSAQEDDGLGLELQETTIRALAERHGFDLVDILRESASGAYLDRPVLNEVREVVRRRRVDAVLVYDADRLSREDVGVLLLQDEAQEHGVSIITRAGVMQVNPTGRLVTFVQGWAAGQEREKTRQRTMDGKLEAAKAGTLPVGTGPGLYGYDYTPRTPQSAPARTINDAEAAVVRRVFAMVAEGLGAYSVAVRLNDEGIPTKTGLKWYPKGITMMVTNPAYKGSTIFGKYQTRLLSRGRRERALRDESEVISISGFTPAIVTEALWERANVQLTRRSRSGRPVEPYLLSGMVVCASCGGRMVGSRQRGHYRYYSCRATRPTAKGPATCTSRSHRVEPVDERIWASVERLLASPAMLERLVTEVQSLQQQAAESRVDADDARAKVEADLRGLEAQQQRLVEAVAAGALSPDDVRARMGALKMQVAAAERALRASEAASAMPAAISIDPGYIKAFANNVKPLLRSMGVEQRQGLLRLLGLQVVAGEPGAIQASVEVPVAPASVRPIGRTSA